MGLFKEFPTQKDTGSQDIVGTIRTGKMDARSKTPYSLEAFRFTADHPDITAKLAELYGGKPGEWETSKPDKFELLSEARSLIVEVRHFDSEFILWGANKPIRVCDGQTQKDEDGDPCQCPSDYWEHRDMAAKGKACKPNVSSKLILVDAPDLGMFKFSSGSWLLASDVEEIDAYLADAAHGSQMEFSIETYETKAGQTRQRPRFSPIKELV